MSQVNKATSLFKKKIQLKKLISLENKRHALAKEHKYTELFSTYKLMNINNRNSGKFWDNKFSESHAVSNFVERDRNFTAARWLMSIVSSGYKVLNIGCGDGKFESLLPSFPLKVSYEGMDFAPKSVKILKEKFSSFNFWIGDITKSRLPKKYDIICIFEVLEHISDKYTFSVIKKIFSSTRKGGFLLVAVPLNEPLLEMFPSNPNEHVRLYSKELICAELEIVGYKILFTEEFIAFRKLYLMKKILSRTILRNRWKPNDVLILAKKE